MVMQVIAWILLAIGVIAMLARHPVRNCQGCVWARDGCCDHPTASQVPELPEIQMGMWRCPWKESTYDMKGVTLMSELERRSMPYSVHVVDKHGRRRFVCRCATIQDCAEVADKLLRGAPGMIVEAMRDTRDGAQAVSVTADPIGRRVSDVAD